MTDCTDENTSGCNDSELAIALNEFKTQITNTLTTQGTAIDNLSTQLSECCTTLTDKMNTIIGLVNTINAKL